MSIMTIGLVYAVESSIKKRFSHIFNSKDAIIATLTSPKFKLKWVESQEQKDAYKQMMVDELCLLDSNTLTEEDDRSGPSGTQGKEKKKDFYKFDTDDDKITADDVESEAVEYFKNVKTLECLSKYQKLKQLFLKYNATIPSSAKVERLFSLGSLALSSRRNRLTDGKFERLLLVRYNKHLVDFI